MDDVSLWLEGIGLGQYAPIFVRESIDFRTLPRITEEDLKDLGLPLGHRRALLAAIEELERGKEKPPNAEPAARAGQRRQLTLMFCDMVDSTRLSTRLDPEDLREIIGAYRLACALPIKRYDGYVGRLIGDGILAYFGYPQAHEDDAERAVRAALDVVEAMTGLNAGLGREKSVELAVRIGIATGFVVVGDMFDGRTREQDAVIGEAPNLAARLQGLARPNTIVVSDKTKQLVGDQFEFLDLGESRLKGLDGLVQVWQVQGETGGSRFAARGPRLSPLVGRDAETELIGERWQRALGGAGQIVLLRGEAGIGKSRVIAAFRNWLAARSDGNRPRILSFQSSPFHSNTSLYPIIRELERLAGVTGSEPEPRKREKLDGLLAGLPEEAPLLVELLAGRSDRPPAMPAMAPSEKRQRTLEALMKWFASLSSDRPLLLLFEDLQWLDPTAKLLLRRLVAWAERSPVLILATLRTTGTSDAPADLELDRWASAPQVTVRDLQPLSALHSIQLMQAVAKGRAVPEPVTETLLRKAEGNPLYIEELTKGWIEAVSDSLHDDDRSAKLHPAVSIPSTLIDALMGRLDKAGAAHEVAQQAAVIGPDFSLSLLSAVSDLPAERLEHGLAALARAEIIAPSGPPTLHIYRFKHALLQDAAYRSLLKSRRRAIHLKLAEHLERESRDSGWSSDEAIGQHYASGGAPRQAIASWRRAAEQAFARSADREAANLLQQAIDLLETIDDAAERTRLELDLTLELAAALRSVYGYAAPIAEEHYRKAHELAKKTGDSSRMFNILWGLMQSSYVKGETGAASSIVKDLFAHAAHHPDKPYVDAYLAEGMVSFQQGEFEAARRSFERGVASSNREADQPHFFTHGQNPGSFCASFLAYTLWFLGFPDTAKATVEANLAIARARLSDASHAHSYVSALTYAVRIHQNRREAGATKSYAEELATIARRNHYSYYEALAVTHLGWANSIERSPEVGIEQMQQGMAAIIRTGTVNTLPSFYVRLAELHARTGQRREALQALDAAKSGNCRGMLFWDAELERVRGEIFLLTEPTDADQAASAFRASLAVAGRQGARSLELRTATSYARLLQRQESWSSAREILGNALAGFEEGSETADLMEARALLDELTISMS
jgi:class 3 adenylate cyclase/predicted negative regulator of RcsB-dependent stress response